jgi:hypothetical protein
VLPATQEVPSTIERWKGQMRSANARFAPILRSEGSYDLELPRRRARTVGSALSLRSMCGNWNESFGRLQAITIVSPLLRDLLIPGSAAAHCKSYALRWYSSRLAFLNPINHNLERYTRNRGIGELSRGHAGGNPLASQNRPPVSELCDLLPVAQVLAPS